MAIRENGGGSEIHWGQAGYNALTRTRDMIARSCDQRGMILQPHERDLGDWKLNRIPLDAQVALLGLLGLLTRERALPEWLQNPDPRAWVRGPGMWRPVEVPMTTLSELADLLGFERTEQGSYGQKHSRSVRRQLRGGISHLLEERYTLFHFWRKGKTSRQHILTRDRILRDLGGGEGVTGTGKVSVGLHPVLLLGSRKQYVRIPVDIVKRCKDALRQAGRNRRMTTPDLSFLLWCYAHHGSKPRGITITDQRLMARLGVDSMIENRNPGRAQETMGRLISLAQSVGALEEVWEIREGARKYHFPGRVLGTTEEMGVLDAGEGGP